MSSPNTPVSQHVGLLWGSPADLMPEPESKPECKSKPESKPKSNARHKKRVDGGYKRYLFETLKKIHPKMRISTKAMDVMNDMMKDMFSIIAEEASNVLKKSGKKTLSSREIQTAVCLFMRESPEVLRHSKQTGTRAICEYSMYSTRASMK